MKLSIAEIIVVLIVALVVLGPDKLPQYAQKLGIALKEFRKFSSDATKDIRESIIEPLEEAQQPIKEAMEPITEMTEEISGNMKGIKKSFDDLGKSGKSGASTPDTLSTPDTPTPEEQPSLEDAPLQEDPQESEGT